MSFRPQKRWKSLLWGLVLFLGLVQSGLLFREVMHGLDTLDRAQTDDIRWNMAQLEVELLHLDHAAQLALSQRQTGAMPDLADLRIRYDIFYSRVAIYRESPLYADLRATEATTRILANAESFLARTSVIVDAKDTELAARLPELSRDIKQLLPDMRAFALAGVRNHADRSAALRDEVSKTLLHLVLTVLLLVSILVVTILILTRLFRRDAEMTRENEVVTSRFEAAIKSSLDAVLIVDTQGHILEFNGAAEQVFGYQRDEILGAQMEEVIVPAHLRDQHRMGMERFLRTGEKRVIGAGRIRLEAMRKSGDIFPVELSITMAETRNRKVFVSYLRDITEEIEAEKELRAARDKAQAGEKAKSDLLTVMSHEMRTPLNGILGSLDLMDRTNLTPQQSRLLDAIGVSGGLLLSHVNDVLDLSRLNAQKSESSRVVFDLTELAIQITDSLRSNALERGNHLQLACLGKGLSRVTGDRVALQQILVNLIGNAIKFTRDGEVRLECERLPDQDMVEFRVSDTGRGIPEDKLEEIFAEFSTIDTDYNRENPGTGLGLAIVKRLVAAMSGEISVDSAEGEGTMFCITLPLPFAEPPDVAAAPVKPKLYRTDARVLVVEDNDINRMILEAMLSEIGCHVTTAVDGVDGVAKAEVDAFDILFIDISMPKKDGIETLADIRYGQGKSANAIAVAATAHAGATDLLRFKQSGFQHVLVKPLSFDQLYDVFTDMDHVIVPPALRPSSASDELNADAFIARFGRDKFDHYIGELKQDLTQLQGALALDQPLDNLAVAEVHRLSGSAATLGLTSLYIALQDIETSADRDWLEKGPDLYRVLTREIEALA